jgi:hypothetical protein
MFLKSPSEVRPGAESWGMGAGGDKNKGYHAEDFNFEKPPREHRIPKA